MTRARTRATTETVTVKVRDGWAVSYQRGPHRHGGDVLDVDRETAGRWLAAGWIEPVTPSKARTTTKATEETVT